MTRAARQTGAGRRREPVPERVPRRGDLGFGALIVSPEPPPAPVTNDSWAGSLRRFTRGLLWALPLYALVHGVVTLGDFDGATMSPAQAGRDPLRLIGWLAAAWLGLVAQMTVVALLAAARSRRTAAAGLLLGVVAVLLTLPFATMPAATPVGIFDARVLVLAGATAGSLAWVVTGWAVARSGVLAAGDGVVLILAAPMLGVAGLLVGPLQTIGAMLAFAAGLGISSRAGRTLPRPGEAARAIGAEAVATQAARPGGLAAP